ncbi:MAG: PAS domain S-box protein, partial [Chitinivibrionales bacterium]
MQKIKTESSPDLTHVVCELSFASDLDSIMRIVRESVRNYTGADGVTFVLREGDTCFYADEEAIEPLWKGQRFPLSQCISGWVMEHKESAIIRDIYADKRIPHDVYRPTFVKSLFMVPIRSADPLGAIGVYWAKEYLPSSEEQAYLRAVADTTAVAVENVRINNMLKQQVRELSEERRRFEGIIEGTHAGTWEWNVQTGEVVFNDIWAGMLGYELSELSPMSIKTWEALVHPEDLGQAKVLLQRHFSGDQDFYKCEFRMKHKNGSWIWVFDRGEVLTRTAEGKPLLMFGTHIDITERKRVELRNVQLNRVLEGIRNVNKTIAREKNPGRLLEESCRLLCDSQGFYNVWIATFNSVEADALNTSSLSSVRGCYSHGFDDGFEVMRNWLSKANVPSCVIQALDRHDVVCVVDPHASCTDCPLAPSYNGRSGLTVKLAHNNRVYGWLNASVPSEYSGDSEEHALLQGVAEDLGHALYSLEMEKQRTIAERAYADMVAVTTDAIIGCDVDGAIDLFNNGAEKLYGCDANSVLGASITRFCPDSLTYEQEQLLERARKEGCVGPVETERISADGKTVSVEMTITVRRDENGAPEGFVGIIRDITLRKKTEQDLKRQAQIIAQVHDSIVITDTEGCITGFNEGAEKLHGYTPDEIMGKDVGILFPPEYRNMFREVVLKELKDNDAHHLEIPMISKSGKEIHVHLSLSLLKDAYGAAIGTIGYALDITDRKKMEKQIEEWQSLFEYIIRYDPNAIAVLDKNLRYLFVSDRFKKDYQVRDQDIIGKHQYDVFPDTPQKWREVHRRALKGEILGQDEDYFPRLNGTEDWTRWECRPWFASGGEV